MPHPMGSARAGDAWGDRGFEVTACIQSGTPIQALRPSTVGGLDIALRLISALALHRPRPKLSWQCVRVGLLAAAVADLGELL